MPGGESVAKAEHVLETSTGWMNYDPVKGQGALAMVHFWVGKKGKSDWKAKDPLLVYSRPKGTYNASKADHVLVDWYLANAEHGDGKFSIKASVSGHDMGADGRTRKVTEWEPYALD